MTFLQSVLLGFVQGATEFLPVSSSGHLAVLTNIFGVKEGNLFFAEMLHLGTLLSVVVVFRKRIRRLIVEFFRYCKKIFRTRNFRFENVYQKLSILLIVSAIPAGLVGVFLNDFFESVFTKLYMVGIGFLITGCMLFFVGHMPGGKRGPCQMNVVDALFAGIMQSIAILPGISRSGSTIGALLTRKLNRKLATEFSFLMSMIPIFGAALLGIIKAVKNPMATIELNFLLFAGVLTSFVIGVLAIGIMVRLLREKKLYYFSYYLIPLGIFVVFADLVGIA